MRDRLSCCSPVCRRQATARVKSFSSTAWSVGDYYQFQVSTLGDPNVALAWDQTSSTTGPRDFLLQYSTNGTTFTPFGSQYSVL